METLFYLYVGSGLLLTLLSIPMIAGKVPPNPLYGFRTSATLRDPRLWYAVNRYSGQQLLVSGLVLLIAAVGLRLVPDLSLDAYALIFLAISVLALAPAFWRSFRYHEAKRKELQNEPPET
jgi:uncharacterized membrane protein